MSLEIVQCRTPNFVLTFAICITTLTFISTTSLLGIQVYQILLLLQFQLVLMLFCLKIADMLIYFIFFFRIFFRFSNCIQLFHLQFCYLFLVYFHFPFRIWLEWNQINWKHVSKTVKIFCNFWLRNRKWPFQLIDPMFRLNDTSHILRRQSVFWAQYFLKLLHLILILLWWVTHLLEGSFWKSCLISRRFSRKSSNALHLRQDLITLRVSFPVMISQWCNITKWKQILLLPLVQHVCVFIGIKYFAPH